MKTDEPYKRCDCNKARKEDKCVICGHVHYAITEEGHCHKKGLHNKEPPVYPEDIKTEEPKTNEEILKIALEKYKNLNLSVNDFIYYLDLAFAKGEENKNERIGYYKKELKKWRRRAEQSEQCQEKMEDYQMDLEDKVRKLETIIQQAIPKMPDLIIREKMQRVIDDEK